MIVVIRVTRDDDNDDDDVVGSATHAYVVRIGLAPGGALYVVDAAWLNRHSGPSLSNSDGLACVGLSVAKEEEEEEDEEGTVGPGDNDDNGTIIVSPGRLRRRRWWGRGREAVSGDRDGDTLPPGRRRDDERATAATASQGLGPPFEHRARSRMELNELRSPHGRVHLLGHDGPALRGPCTLSDRRSTEAHVIVVVGRGTAERSSSTHVVTPPPRPGGRPLGLLPLAELSFPAVLLPPTAPSPFMIHCRLPCEQHRHFFLPPATLSPPAGPPPFVICFHLPRHCLLHCHRSPSTVIRGITATAHLCMLPPSPLAAAAPLASHGVPCAAPLRKCQR